jgi:hypothetical protein
MKVQLTIDLNRILTEPGRDAFEQYFGHFPPNEEKAIEALSKGEPDRITKEDFDSMLAYLVKKTILEDDGRGELFRVTG